MLSLHVPVLLASLLAGGGAATSSSFLSASDVTAAHAEIRGACAPGSSVRVELSAPGAPQKQSRVVFEVVPELDVEWIETEVELPLGGELYTQQVVSSKSALAGQRFVGSAQVGLPQAVVAGHEAGAVLVRARFGLRQPDGSVEALAVEELLVLGEAPLPMDATPVFLGARARLDVPADHRVQAHGLAAGAPASSGGTTVTGEMRYEDRGYAFQGWTGDWPELPVRLAEVAVLDANTEEVLASGHTAQDGSYALFVPGSGVRDLIVRCSTTTTRLAPAVASVDDGSTPYSVSSPVFEGHGLGVDLDAGVVVAKRQKSGNLLGSAFNAYDQMVLAFEYVAALGAPPDQAPVQVVWPANSSAGGEDTVWLEYPHSYSDPLVLHELGHMMDARFSEPDSSGGQHTFGQSDQQPSLSLSEGWATYFNAAARQWAGQEDPGFYFQGSGLPSTGNASVLLRADLETRAPFAHLTAGEADELAVAAALWDVADTASTPDGDGVDDDLVDGGFAFAGGLRGDELVFAGMRSRTVEQADSVHVVDLMDSFFHDLRVVRGAELRDAFVQSEIRAFPDAVEPNDRLAQAAPLLPGEQWSDVMTLWSSTVERTELGRGDVDVYAVALAGGHVYRFQTRYPLGANDAETYVDTRLSLLDSEGVLFTTDFDSGVGRNAKVELAVPQDVTWFLEVAAQHPGRPTGSYQVRVRDMGLIPAPEATSLEPSTLVTVSPGYQESLWVTGVGMLGVTSVTVGGLPASFAISTDTSLVFQLPQTGALGVHEVVLSGPAGSDSLALEVVAPESPTLSAGGEYWHPDGISVWFGAEPGDTLLLFFSLSAEPTSVPGVVDLELGAGGTSLWQVATHTTGGSGWAELEFPFFADIDGFVDVWLQGAVVPAAGSTGSLETTNLVKGLLQ